ncbi:unnamed protein product, partial [Sphenostylis stenocarpa]
SCGEYNVEKSLPSKLASDDAISIVPETVLAHKVINKAGNSVNPVLIQWQGQKNDVAKDVIRSTFREAERVKGRKYVIIVSV